LVLPEKRRINYLLPGLNIPEVVLLARARFKSAGQKTGGEKMKITSPEFDNNGFIPAKFTCQGKDVSPQLVIEDVPQEAKSLALVVDDPDAPMGIWVHWVVYDIPVIFRIEESTVPGKQGINNFGKMNYGGPCPPSGTHRYFFKIYALDKELGLSEGIDKKALEKAMEGHILGKAELIGLYKKN
jgi:Raf kinase inhibitor-like YbhB/YbcL family protein